MKKIQNSIFPLLSAAGFLFFIQQGLFYAQRLGSIIDEGAYLVRGAWFASGTYGMYVPYGPVTNHMPLSFLPYGFIQQWFGPGLWEGRLFAIFLGVVGLAGVWSLVRRLWGHGWAALAVWALVINPVIAQTYSQALSQVLVFALFSWALALSVGRDRSNWQIISGAVLGVLIYLSRINMIPVYGLLMIYIFWRHGKTIGWRALWVSLVVLAVFHIFAPGLLDFEWKIYEKYLGELFSFTTTSAANNSGSIPYWSQISSVSDRWTILLLTLRTNFVSVLGVLVVVVLAGLNYRRLREKDLIHEFVLMVGLYLILFGIHAYFSMYSTHCVYCLPSYSGFFSFLGVLMLVMAFQLPPYRNRAWPSAAALLTVFSVLSWGMFYQGNQDAGAFIRPLYNGIPGVQRFNNLLGVAAGRLGLPYTFEGGIALSLTALLAAVAGILVLGQYLASKRNTSWPSAPLRTTLILATAVGLLLSPTPLLGGVPNENLCRHKTTATYEAAGKYLAARIPAGSRVFWYTGISAAPLLHLEGVEFFHPTINNNYFRFIGGDEDRLRSFGAWNEQIAFDWVEDADYILLSDATRLTYGGDNDIGLRLVEAAGMELLDTTERVVDCRIYSPIYIYGKP